MGLMEENIRGVKQALADHLVVFLPEQHLTLDDLERVTDLMGGRDKTPYIEPVEGRPYVIRVVKEATDTLNFANAWHSDLSYLAEPPAYTILHAWEVPEYGGDTVWANQHLAYETLSNGLRDTLTSIRALHTAGEAYGPSRDMDYRLKHSSMPVQPSEEAFKECPHPAVIEHPLSGKPALYVNQIYTKRFEGWSHEESATLLTHLFHHSTHENLTVRLHWARHTLAIWDNRSVVHNALNDYQGTRREMYRTSVKGAAPKAAAPVPIRQRIIQKAREVRYR
jgi:taurine dioxygenase